MPAEPSSLSARVLRRIRKRWRAWLRALHRDIGYLAIGLTVIYAVSGLAINHIEDWNPNFKTISRTHELPGPIPEDEAAATAYVLDKLGIAEKPRDSFKAGNQLEIELDQRRLVVDTDTGAVFEDGEEPRLFLRIANWLHYNRGKAAWTYIADGYAILLLYLAISGMFMLKGRLGIRGRGAVLIIVGAAVPTAYVILSGGPGG